MTPEEIHLVQASWEKVRPISTQASELFYGRLFHVAPELKLLFKTDMRAQGHRLMQTIDTAVRELEHWDSLVPVLQKLGERHVGYGVRAADYDTVGSALLWTLERGLGDAFTDDVKQAWIAAFTAIAETMKQAAADARPLPAAAGP